MKNLLYAIPLLAMLVASPASAQYWVIDDNHSQAAFTIDHIVGKVSGFFKSFQLKNKGMESSVRFDPKSPQDAAFNIVINTWTVDTGIDRRDKHLATADFFDCVKFPHITFTSEKIEKLDNGDYAATGKLTIKDVTKAVTVPFTFVGQTQHPLPAMNTNVGAIEARFNLNRLEYNVGDGKFSEMGLVGQDVQLTIYLEMFSR